MKYESLPTPPKSEQELQWIRDRIIAGMTRGYLRDKYIAEDDKRLGLIVWMALDERPTLNDPFLSVLEMIEDTVLFNCPFKEEEKNYERDYREYCERHYDEAYNVVLFRTRHVQELPTQIQADVS